MPKQNDSKHFFADVLSNTVIHGLWFQGEGDSDLRKLSSGKPLTSYIAQAELCKSRLNSAS